MKSAVASAMAAVMLGAGIIPATITPQSTLPPWLCRVLPPLCAR